MDNTIKLKLKNPKQFANIFSQLSYVWLVKFCYKAVKEGLEVQDLFEALSPDKSKKLGDNLEKFWNTELKIAKEKGVRPSLLRAIRKMVFCNYMFQGILLLITVAIIRPFVPLTLSLFVGLFSEAGNREKNVLKEMWIYGGVLMLISFILVFYEHNLNFLLMQTGMRVRIACSSLIYRKMLTLNKKSLNESTAGQIVNLLSNDVSRFDTCASAFHYLWITPIQVTFTTYLLWKQVEVATFIGLGLLILLTVPVHMYIAKLTSRLRFKIALKTDSRVKKMNEIISGIQIIKMYAWEKPFAEIVNAARFKEIKFLKWISYVKGTIIGSFIFIEKFILFITIISYVLFGNRITADNVFSLAQFFNILQMTLAIRFPMAVCYGAETLISIKRLEDFLMLEQKPVLAVEEKGFKSIVLKDIHLSWDTGTKILNGVNIKIPSATLCAIVGAVGEGKSTLLQLLLGELIAESGSIEAFGNISYSSQEAWLFASTVRKNILFGQKYDPVRYKNVVRVCALERDFESLPYGDNTLVGDRGVSLSGGQKARINLARAVYRDADIYLLDDPLSAVDTRVGKHLFEECIVGFLKGKTRILVTHQLQYLKRIDHLVVINKGKTEIQGSYSELLRSDLDFAKIFITSDESCETEYIRKRKESLEMKSTLRRESVLSTLNQASDNIRVIQYGKEEENEETSVKLEVSAYREYAKAGGNTCQLLMLIFFFVSAQVAANCCDLWVTYWTKQEAECPTNYYHIEELPPLNASEYANHTIYFYETQNLSKNSTKSICEDYLSVHSVIYIYTALICICVALVLFRSLYYYTVAMNASKNLHNKMFSCLTYAPMRFFDRNPSGRILNRFSRDIGIIDELLPRMILESLQIICVMIGILIIVAISNVYMITIIMLLAIPFYKLISWYLIIIRKIKNLDGITKSSVFSHVTASLNGISTIRASSTEATLIQEFDEHQDVHTSAWYMVMSVLTSFGIWFDILSFMFIASTIVSFILMHLYGEIDSSRVGLAISQALILNGMVQYGMMQTVQAISHMISVERILEYTKLDKESQTTSTVTVPPKFWPNSGAIDFDHVNLKYDETEAPVLKNINLSIKAGEKIGIVGRTGAGKSSLICALFQLAPVEGCIKIDGINTKTVELNDLRKNISIIPQDPVLFAATLRYNLDPFNEYSDEAIWKALEEAQLKDIAITLDYYVQEGGDNFSVGQKQLLCLARAILRNNKILILDEATANVDSKTDELIQKTVRNKFSKCTVLTIAHRLHTVMDSDKVLVMDAGNLVEYDHPHLLLQNPDGYLCNMVKQSDSSMAAHLYNIAEIAYLQAILEEEENSYL